MIPPAVVVGAGTLLARRADASLGFFGGFARGVMNPTLAANWTTLVAGLTAAGLYVPSPSAGLTFALGVGAGVTSYFALLARTVGAARIDKLGPWLRRIGALTGAGLVVAGGLGAARALVG